MVGIILVLALAVIMSGGLAYFFLSRDGGPAEPIWALAASFAIGCAAAQLAGIINSYLVPLPTDQMITIQSALLIGIVPGFFEELLKVIPITFFVSSQRFFSNASDGVIYFSFSGLAFGLLENIDYTIQSGAGVGFSRLMSLLFFHAATSGIFGYYFARARQRSSWVGPLLTMVSLILVHAAYNFSLAYMSSLPALAFAGYLIPLALTLLLIYCFAQARQSR